MKHLNLIGCAENWQDAPTTGECWGITSLVLKRDNITRTFDMHDFTWTVQQWIDHYLIWMGDRYGRNYIRQRAVNRVRKTSKLFKRINKLAIPFYSLRSYASVPTSIAYPFEDISTKFKTELFASTADFALALAIYEGYTRIDLYGFKMNVQSEWEHQVPSFNYWIGLAKGLGIKIKIHGKSAILRTKTGLIYGYNRKPKVKGGELCLPV